MTDVPPGDTRLTVKFAARVHQVLFQEPPVKAAASVLPAVLRGQAYFVGTFADAGSGACVPCAAGKVSSPESRVCESCEGVFIRGTPDALRQTCHFLAMDVILGLIFLISSALFCFLFLAGFFGKIHLADVSAQGQKLVTSRHDLHGSFPLETGLRGCDL